MKKNFLSTGLLAILILGVIIYTNIYADSYKENKVRFSNADIKISVEKAKKIALSHSKVAEKDARISKIKLDRENKKLVYEIQFYTDKKKYDYDVDANTGEILSYSHKNLRNTDKLYSSKKMSSHLEMSEKNYIGEEKAKEIALSKIPGAKKSHIVKLHLDREKGKIVYEGKIIYNYTEYEFDIDAVTGEILTWEVDRD
ncbi:peptidase M4 [Leptotrichia sp. OH3620_COT-345]|uniref:PepSY domain-containing protein n=1 Tax=Leptotrichia sp. OH3620_COT-345 TaxID=2491048 RepID=UPI000F64B50D|nr:PepSY domain-containing protein [Leptotrichia sp. OH3620_COT-345]RRD40213.1 peptidase M4 [Leptotrichia sp. OH3620_COT-345]